MPVSRVRGSRGSRLGVGVVLLDLGGPRSLEEVGPFLFRFFSSPAILPLPGLTRKVLARLIAILRVRRAREKYRAIGGSSPLPEELAGQARDLQRALGEGYVVRHACLFTDPSLDSVLRDMAQEGVVRALAVPIFPQCSRVTAKACIDVFNDTAIGLGLSSEHTPSFPTGDLFLSALSSRALHIAAGSDHLLFVAHGLPASAIKNGDPYLDEVHLTAEALGSRLTEEGLRIPWSLAFQSRLGPIRWIGPAIEEEIRRLAIAGVRSLTVVPLSFGCENLETLFDLDLEAADLARSVGIMDFRRAATPGRHPLFIEELARQTRRAAGDAQGVTP